MCKKVLSKFSALMAVILAFCCFCGCAQASEAYKSLLGEFSDEVYFSSYQDNFQELIDNGTLTSTLHYDRLTSDTQRYMYQAVVLNALAFTDKYRIPSHISKSNLTLALDCVRLDSPQLFYVSDSVSFSTGKFGNRYLQIDYSITQSKYKMIMDWIDRNISDIVDYAGALDSIYERALAVHDYIVNSIEYDEVYNVRSRSIYGALGVGKAGCQGYTQGFQYIMNKLGCRSVNLIDGEATTADGLTQGHAWNSIILDDGRNYYIDTTWDDTTEKAVNHTYFLIEESELNKNHKKYQPAGNLGSKYLYYAYNDLIIGGSYENIKSQLTDLLERAVENDSRTLEFKLDSADKTAIVIDGLFSNSDFFDCVRTVRDRTGIYAGDSIVYYYEEDLGCFNVVLTGGSEF